MVGSQGLSWGAALGPPTCAGMELWTQPGPTPESPPRSLQGFSTQWWNFRHNQHHAKTNVLHKDPDVTLAPIFVLGELSTEVCGVDMDTLRLGWQLRGDRQPLRPPPWPNPSP